MSKHISPVLKELHWLPVRQWIDHKIVSLVYKCYKGTAPEYLQEHIPRYVPAWPLHSSLQPHLQIPSAAEKKMKKIIIGFPSLFQLCTQALECPTTNNQGSRPFGCILQIPENTPVLWMNLHHVSFFCSFCFLFFCSCLFLVIYIPTPHPFQHTEH